jgi:hypothetical protein
VTVESSSLVHVSAIELGQLHPNRGTFLRCLDARYDSNRLRRDLAQKARFVAPEVSLQFATLPELRDLVSVHSAWLSAEVPEFAAAPHWPEPAL